MHWRELTLERIDDAVLLYEAGWSLARIGDRMGVDPTMCTTDCGSEGCEPEIRKDVVDDAAGTSPNSGSTYV